MMYWSEIGMIKTWEKKVNKMRQETEMRAKYCKRDGVKERQKKRGETSK